MYLQIAVNVERKVTINMIVGLQEEGNMGKELYTGLCRHIEFTFS
jgi:hypothetical protein